MENLLRKDPKLAEEAKPLKKAAASARFHLSTSSNSQCCLPSSALPDALKTPIPSDKGPFRSLSRIGREAFDISFSDLERSV